MSNLSKFSTVLEHAQDRQSALPPSNFWPQTFKEGSLGLPGRKPTFLIIGAAKCGTTSLWHQLGQHPQIYMHRTKQLNFFSNDGPALTYHGPMPVARRRPPIGTWEEYCHEFNVSADKIALGEASNSYLYNQGAAQRIRHCIPSAKLIAILRHPAERAHSRYLHLLSLGREPIRSFEEALKAETTRMQDRWWPEFYYLNVGLYHQQLARYFALFPAEQMKIYLYEDLLTNPLGTLQGIFRFLNVNTDFIPQMNVRFSASGLPKNKSIDWLLKRLRAARPAAEKFLPDRQLNQLLRIAGDIHIKNLKKPLLSQEAREWLIAHYREDTLRLQDLIKRDLSAWLK